MTTAVLASEKPKLRGVLHQWAAAFAVGAGVVLVALAPTPRTALASALYSLSLVGLFTISATYHRVNWAPRGRAWMRRMDHAAIFLLIAGTYTPVAMLGLPEELGNRLMLYIYVGALVGILQSLFWVGAPKFITAALAVAVGWIMMPYFGEVFRALGAGGGGLIIAGGIAYTTGALAYAFKRPNPIPGVFGYHEVFHALTIVGAGFHFVLVLQMVRAAG
ncbi:MAG: hemolysin III [Myxococcaceae bacterium]|nr:MAG: hemolysin III [Myxococcaceae bacterium]